MGITYFEVPENSSFVTIASLSTEASCRVHLKLEDKTEEGILEGRDQIELSINRHTGRTLCIMNLTVSRGSPLITIWTGRTTPPS